jgi:4-hydroxybenzoate polyprenyltransferase
LRIIAGTLAISAQWSFWLLAFSMFFFLSLAIAKRVSELENVKKENKGDPVARGYKITDISMLNSTGISAGYISVLVIALYINSAKVADIYHKPEILWFICPLLLYWIGRLWIITSRGLMHEDPIVFALRDRTSIVILALIGLVFSIAVLV